ncbi:tetratricopeptide repeat protein, partial [bacterium]|nr:tetratricopeptide repeat protein [bacterium]
VFISLMAVLTFAASAAFGDLITTKNGSIEGRVLENSAKVLVVETIAGEYVVLGKDRIASVKEEAREEFYFRRGRYYELNGDDGQALVDYLEVLNINPDHQRAKEGIEAIQTRQRNEKMNEKIEEAQEHVSQESYREALDSYREVLNMQPEERTAQRVVRRMSETHARIAYLYYNHCLDQDAIIELAKAEELNPNSAEIYYVLGRIHETKRKYTIARLEYERALELDPNHSAARAHLMELIERTRGRLIR